MKNLFAGREQSRWMRPDAANFVRPDWRRHVKAGSEAATTLERYERKFRPDQPRVPAGESQGGQWTADGGGGVPEAPDASSSTAAIQKEAERFAAGGRTGYLRCIDICSPLLERFQKPGSDRNQWDFHKCMNICLGR